MGHGETCWGGQVAKRGGGEGGCGGVAGGLAGEIKVFFPLGEERCGEGRGWGEVHAWVRRECDAWK